MSSLLLLSTADTDLLALRRAEPEGFGTLEALNPARVEADGVQRLATAVREGAYWAVGFRLLGGRRAFPDGFDALRRACAEAGVPFLAWPGERGQDLELEAASTAPGHLLADAGRYWDEGGVENVANLLQALSDALRGNGFGAALPAEVPRNGVYRRAAAGSARVRFDRYGFRRLATEGRLPTMSPLCRGTLRLWRRLSFALLGP